MQQRIQKILRNIAKATGWTLLTMVVLLLIIIGLIQLPPVQHRITQEAVAFLEKKTGTEVRLERLYISFPKRIVVKGLYMEDQLKDTLAYIGELTVDTDLWALTNREVQLNDITLQNTTLLISRASRDSAFNFDYIIEAFAGNETPTPDTTDQGRWAIDIRRISLEEIRTQYHDSVSAIYANVKLGTFETRVDQFTLETLTVHVDDLILSDSEITFLHEGKSAGGEPAEGETTPDISFQDISLINVAIRYRQKAAGQQGNVQIGNLSVSADELKLEDRRFALDKVVLENSMIAWIQDEASVHESGSGAAANGGSAATTPPSGEKDWNFSVGHIAFKNNSLQYVIGDKRPRANAFDASHIAISELSLNAKDLSVDGIIASGNISDFSFEERSGFHLQSMRGNFSLGKDSATIESSLLTNHSQLNVSGHATYAALARLFEKPEETMLRLEMSDSHIGLQDVLILSPTIRDSIPLHIPPSQRIHLNTSVSGHLNDLHVHQLELNTLNETRLLATARVEGLVEDEEPAFAVHLRQLFTTRRDLSTVLPDTLLPDSITVPGWININARYSGTMSKANFQTLVTTDLGSLEASGDMDLDSTSAGRGYYVQWAVDSMDIGTLLRQPDTYGHLIADGTVSSDGLVPDEMKAALNATIRSFAYAGYLYQDLTLKAQVYNNVLTATAGLDDSNLNFVFSGEIDFQEDIPNYKVTLDLRKADFYALKLSERHLRARGTLEVDMATADMRVLNGSAGIRNVAIFNGDDLYMIDSLLFASIDQDGRSEINIDSDLLAGRFEGTLNVFEMAAVLREYFHTYYSLHDSAVHSDEARQRFAFHLELKKTELLTDILLPELSSFTPGEISGVFDSDNKQLNLRFDIPEFRYANFGVTSFRFRTTSDTKKLNYNLLVDRVQVDSMLIDGFEMNGTVADDSIRANVVIRDSLDYNKYVIGGTFYSRQDHFEFRFDPEQIILNYENWSIPPENFIRFGGEKIIVQRVELAHAGQKIVARSDSAISSPLTIGFEQLSLAELTSMVAGERPVTGILDGRLDLFQGSDPLQFNADIDIRDLIVARQPWGDVKLTAQQAAEDRLGIYFGLSGPNEIRLQGNYYTQTTPTIDLRGEIRKFDLSILEPLQNQVVNLKGNLQGSFDVTGSTEQPDIKGSLSLENTSFFSNFLQTDFAIASETLSFDNRGVRFDGFQITDANNNTATLNGRVITPNYTDIAFDLDLNTSNFQLLNTKEGDNELFYGLIHLNSRAKITGTMDTPKVSMEISLSDEDHLTYVVPQSEASIIEQEGIIRFVDKSAEANEFIKSIQHELEDTVKTTFRGVDLTAKVELTDAETFTIVIDPSTGDQLTIRGDATLTLQMDPTGDMQLSGRYEITEGTYNFSFYKFVKREFSIQEGSAITWTGDMLNANMDITAAYHVNTSPIDLMSNQVTSPEDLNQFRTRKPFIVYMNLAGELLAPEISFQLDMPLNERNAFGGNVYARITDINTRESDLNKQVFALLILKRFVSDNPFENQAASGLEGTARSSVSKILTDQLNRLGENIRGVELSFDVRSYEQYEGTEAQGQTELQLGVSKRFLDDRLVIKLSGNVDIEGQNRQRQVTDYIGDLSLEYLLTEDGRFRIRGFRNSDYDIIDGELIETGAGFIYIKNYNKLRELFKSDATTEND